MSRRPTMPMQVFGELKADGLRYRMSYTRREGENEATIRLDRLDNGLWTILYEKVQNVGHLLKS